ncbi:MAG: hypothetical protein L0Y58_23315 [Verrucomicrobia subdivision 3 bacterium]|nr:hypothetical protein [Limisphaerales bacterium]
MRLKHTLAVFAMTALPLSGGGANFRTDINPALLYHQAFLLAPDLSQDDRTFLFVTQWRSQAPDPRCVNLITKYDNMFKLIRQAAHAQVPCDWGLDITDGPEALLPGLARAKNAAQVVWLRARQHLIDGKQEAARDELLAVIVMARNTSRDGVLISALVQIAIENIVTSFIAENFYRFTPQTLQELAAGLEATPARGPVRQCMAVEKYSFCDWLIRKIQEFDATSGGNHPVLHAKLREMWGKSLFDPEDKDRAFLDQFLQATDGTANGLITYVRQLEPLYAEATEILGLPWAEFQVRQPEFAKKVEGHPNLLAAKFFPALEKAREREFAILAKLAMLQAAIRHKLGGEAAFKALPDPFGDGPFGFERFVLDGIDRGFKLTSKLNCRDHIAGLILIETPGPAVRVDSKYIGQMIP